MGKSLEEVWAKMQAQQQAERQQREEQERAINEAREKQRREWQQRNRMFEAVSSNNNAAASSSAAAGAAGAGAGGGLFLRTKTDFYIFDSNSSSIGYVKTDSTIAQLTTEPFNGLTVLAGKPDEPGYLYYVTYDEGPVIFGRVNIGSGAREDISDLTEQTQNYPGSLQWANGRFLYYNTNPYLGGGPSPYQIFEIYEDGSIMSLSEIEESFSIMCVCEIAPGNVKAGITDGFLGGIADIDINTGELTNPEQLYMDPATLPEGIVNTKDWVNWSLVTKNDKLYVLGIYTDKDHGTTPYQFIGEINLETNEVKHLYNLGILGDPYVWSSIAVI